MRSRIIARTIALLSVGVVLAGCQSSDGVSTRTALLGTGGAVAGAAIGANQAGATGAIVGGLIGGLAGLAVGMVLDDIEREQIEQANLAAARANQVQTRSFKNSKGQKVKTTSRPVRTYKNTSGESCREVSTTVSRDGQDAGTQTTNACQVRVGRSATWKEVT